VIYTAPFIATQMETAFLEVEPGEIEAYQAMGIKRRSIIWHVLLREARPAIILGLTIATVRLVGATARAGRGGATGSGDSAYGYGHIQYEAEVMYATVLILIVLVQAIRMLGNYFAKKLKKDKTKTTS